MTPYYEEQGITIYHGDCREILPQLPKVDLVLTDPPYGVLHGSLDDRAGRHGLAKAEYISYDDTYENFLGCVVPGLNRAIDIAERAAVFTGPHIQDQRKASAIGGIYCPAGCGRHSWGFKTFLPVLFYGIAPDLNKGAQSNTIHSTATAEKNGHPCPKPLEWLLWLVRIGSRPGESILDPFAGSGTTLVAAKRLGRRAIGIEIEEKYCEIAARRLQQASLPLFDCAQPSGQMSFER